MTTTVQERNHREAHWVGLDVSKATFDAALALWDQRFPSTPVRALPWRTFPRTREGVAWKTLRPGVQRVWKTWARDCPKQEHFDLTLDRLSLGYER